MLFCFLFYEINRYFCLVDIVVSKIVIMEKFHLLCSGLSLLGINSVYAQSIQMPNIVLINIDDLGWTDLSCNGSEYYETPNIDRLKKKGIWFQKAYAGAANSAPRAGHVCLLG